ncbi:MAG: DUF2163 domain-containing protein [Rickettsiaceae bacterium]|nr:DUF2163 domain-containing protein [Rickettsiaceae bacterium]
MNANLEIICFEILTEDNKILRFTEYSSPICFDDNTYSPISGVKLDSVYFDETSENNAVIKGFFEKGGISKDQKLLGGFVTVLVYKNSRLEPWFKYKISRLITSELTFTLILKPATYVLSQQAVSLYSKTCRAVFGDAKCTVDKLNYPGEECDKSLTSCVKRFNNSVNFRGEPFIPTYEYFNKINE